MLSKIILDNFRNYEHSEYRFEKQTVFCGRNGIGKSNILEAIYLCSVGKSFRGASDKDMIRDGQDYYRVAVSVKGGEKEKLELIFQNNSDVAKKTAKLNGIKLNLSKFIGNLKLVIYSFESNEIILGSPGARRRFLDTLLCQLYPKYTYNLLKLFKILKNRNRLLYKIKIREADPGELDFWNVSLCQLSREITLTREKALAFLSDRLNIYYNELGAIESPISLKYVAQSIFEPSELVKHHRREVEAGVSLFGPHRDEILFLINNHPVSKHLSRGEIKSLLFALKKCEVEFIKEVTAQSPIILIDDILAELDINRRDSLVSFIGQNQAVITSTELNAVKKLFSKAKIIGLDG